MAFVLVMALDSEVKLPIIPNIYNMITALVKIDWLEGVDHGYGNGYVAIPP